MFTWNVEEMKLMNMPRENGVFACEFEVSIEDKIEFVDRMQEGKLTYILDLVKKLGEDVETLKKDTLGNPTKAALRTWVRKNDTREIICRCTDSRHDYGEFEVLGVYGKLLNYPNCFELWSSSENSYINSVFHRQLQDCLNKEGEYYRLHDPRCKLISNIQYLIESHLRNAKANYDYKTTFRFIIPNIELREPMYIKVCNYDTGTTELTTQQMEELNSTLSPMEVLYEKYQQAKKEYEEACISTYKEIDKTFGI